uniref:Uncharacterized protein n=1 Tax=Tetranychus urticae TaxID=32264 RepID=T1L644_TETUR
MDAAKLVIVDLLVVFIPFASIPLNMYLEMSKKTSENQVTHLMISLLIRIYSKGKIFLSFKRIISNHQSKITFLND